MAKLLHTHWAVRKGIPAAILKEVDRWEEMIVLAVSLLDCGFIGQLDALDMDHEPHSSAIPEQVNARLGRSCS